jgi:hypothetical protein
MYRLALIALLSLSLPALAEEPTTPPSPPKEPTVTLTQSELAAHDELVASRAVANQLVGEAMRKAQSVEAKIAAAANPPQAKPVPPPTVPPQPPVPPTAP